VVYSFTVLGHPITKSNFKPKGGGGSKESRAQRDRLYSYEENIANSVSCQMAENKWEMLSGNLQMMIVLYKEEDRGDVQNYPKSICDALEGVLYKNDSCIKIFGGFTGGIDKDNPRVIIKISPIEKMEYFVVGTLAYQISDELKYLLDKKKVVNIKKEMKYCRECGAVLFKKKVGNWEFWSCKNNHHYSIGAI